MMANITEPMKLAPMIEIKFGKISIKIMRHDDSPITSADFINSFSSITRPNSDRILDILNAELNS